MIDNTMTDQLVLAAQAARLLAYAPYSGYLVGAAILDSRGNIWTGCNVENISYGVSICAERSAICTMISSGEREICAVAVATRDGGTPCGLCLQTLLEFVRDPQKVQVVTVSDVGEPSVYVLGELIPHGFSSKDLRRT